MINIIPVMDLMDGIAVSGKSGNRNTYTPLKSVYSNRNIEINNNTNTSTNNTNTTTNYNNNNAKNKNNPLYISKNLKIKGFKSIYIADLDAIESRNSKNSKSSEISKVSESIKASENTNSNNLNINIIKEINEIIPVILDCGITDLKSFEESINYADKLIVATETLKSIDELKAIFNKFDNNKIVISVDIKDNKLYSKNISMSINDFKKEIASLYPKYIIVLDISKVGTGKLFNKDIINSFSEFKDSLILGGGITAENLRNIKDYDIKNVLIGTDLHNGKLF